MKRHMGGWGHVYLVYIVGGAGMDHGRAGSPGKVLRHGVVDGRHPLLPRGAAHPRLPVGAEGGVPRALPPLNLGERSPRSGRGSPGGGRAEGCKPRGLPGGYSSRGVAGGGVGLGGLAPQGGGGGPEAWARFLALGGVRDHCILAHRRLLALRVKNEIKFDWLFRNPL